MEDHEDKKAEECEADMFSMDYLINFLLHTKESIEWSSEIEKLFLAIYFMMEKIPKQMNIENSIMIN